MPVFFDSSTQDTKDSTNGQGVGQFVGQAVVMNEQKHCLICHEKFETYWDEEEEEWMVKNAIRTVEDDKTYHQNCYADKSSVTVAGTKRKIDETGK